MGINLTLLLMDETNKNKLNLDEGARIFIWELKQMPKLQFVDARCRLPAANHDLFQPMA
jgi:hypothetical protein